MEELVDLIAKDGSANDVHSKIKDLLYAKSADKIEALRPNFSTAMFDVPSEVEPEEPEQEVTQDSEE
jgi:hypothetical protein